MAYDKLVDGAQLDSDLGDIADAIRAKGGTSASLAFPAGFVSAVQEIETGTTPSGTKNISISTNGTTIEDVTNYASAQITVAVPQPSGSTTLTDNGTYDISQYASVVVAVPAASGVSF